MMHENSRMMKGAIKYRDAMLEARLCDKRSKAFRKEREHAWK
jgi:hypothetical protein